MKIRRPWLIRTLVMVGYWFVRVLLSTVFCKYWQFGPDLRPANVVKHKRCIYALWHEYTLVPLVRFSHSTARLLVSQHADGMIVAEMCKHLRMGVVRGSTRHNGVQAVRELLRPSRFRSLAVTPDGPQGPRRQAKVGIIYLAARLGWPIIPIGVGYRRPWRLRSWDRFAIPRPFLLTATVTSEAIHVPAGLSREEMEGYRQHLEDVLNALTERAEMAAETGRRPAPLAKASGRGKKVQAA